LSYTPPTRALQFPHSFSKNGPKALCYVPEPSKSGAPPFPQCTATLGQPRLTFYSIILATTPAPTVRPPSRIANRRPSSMAIGAIKFTFIFTLSPGITISVPSGNSIVPVMSVVRK